MKNGIFAGVMYKIVRTLLFFFPTEDVHYFSMNMLKALCKWGWSRKLVTWACRPEEVKAPYSSGQKTGQLSRELFGLSFRNPVGLGAGFDKNALYLRELEALGFGFVEIGTVTPLPQDGNEQPRLFRLPEDQALINRMGFNNDGVKVIAERLKKWRQRTNNQGPQAPLIIGGNIGKNKVTPNEDAWKDYGICFRELFDFVDYFVVNVSSPNTPGLRELQEKDALRKILTSLQEINKELALGKGVNPRPLLLKIAPDLSWQQIDDVVELALDIRLDGLVATNTTISREKLLSSADRLERIGAGGLSGAPLKEKSTEVVRYIHRKTSGSLPLIASGGIFTGGDALEKIQAGAGLVQVWTGFIYEGPFITRRICAKL
ncbi:MAG TPA: quinone-dependent dihydroorotate dehydrogenase [Puia sp.]|nr:quinone-dependent dihydroorotate dehydrogenase [Puia sp.]